MGLDTQLYVYGPSGGAGYPASSLYADDDGGWGKLSKIAAASFTDAGKYAVVVAAKNKTRGNYRLVVTCLSGQCEPEPVTTVGSGNGNGSGTITVPNDHKDTGTPPNDDAVRARKRRHLIAYGVGGLGLVGLGVGGFFGLKASGLNDDAKKTCGGSITSCDPAKLPIAQKQVDDARSAANISTVGFIAGGALAVTGVVIYLTAPKVVENNTVKVTPVVGGGTVGATFELRF
jgi:serine/threonine-protein kinase